MRIAWMMLVAMVAISMAGCDRGGSAGSESTGSVFATPEEAILHYLEGVAQADAREILQACAVEEMTRHFRFDLHIERLGGAFQASASLFPAEYPLYAEANRMQLTSRALNRVKMCAYGLLFREEMQPYNHVRVMSADDVADCMKQVEPARLAKLEVKKIGLPKRQAMNSAEYMQNSAKEAQVYGADEFTERVALLSFDQSHYFLGFTLLRYGETWKIQDQVSYLAGTNDLGVPEETTVEEFEELTRGQQR